jgi:uncharacterized protein (TIGR03118 family)
MNAKRALGAHALWLLGALILNGCGGYGSGGMSMLPATVTVSVSPATINVGQSATLTWSSNAAKCTASGAWSGAQSGSGTMSETPTAAGTQTFTLMCSSGAYSSGSASATLTVNAASAFSLTALVADTAGGTATNVDANLVNAWGLSIAAAPATNPAWIANNGTQTSTLYDGTGKPLALVVGFAGTTFNPTGIAFNPSATDFVVTSGGNSGSSKFVFVGEGGMIAGWSPGVDLTHAVTMYTDAGGAVYKGLAIAANGGAWFLYATDFHNAKIDVLDTNFAKQATSATAFTFSDPGIPAGYAPFGIQAINNGAAGATQIYVSYAQQKAPDNHDEVDGAGLGYVDIYDTNGKLTKQLVAGGALNAPWGMALAPADFGTLSNALLVGNFGDGSINGYDATTGEHLGAITNAGGVAIAVPGLWGIAFGNDANNQPHNTLFVSAGPNAEADGSYGRIDLGAAPPTLGAAPVVTLTVPASPLTGMVSLSATATDTIAISKVQFWANTTLIGTATTAPYSVNWDTTKWPNGPATVEAKAVDANGNVGSSAPSAATIAN